MHTQRALVTAALVVGSTLFAGSAGAAERSPERHGVAAFERHPVSALPAPSAPPPVAPFVPIPYPNIGRVATAR